jgi:hypothetical protein
MRAAVMRQYFDGMLRQARFLPIENLHGNSGATFNQITPRQ